MKMPVGTSNLNHSTSITLLRMTGLESQQGLKHEV